MFDRCDSHSLARLSSVDPHYSLILVVDTGPAFLSLPSLALAERVCRLD
jgi:hypothetical protein